VSNDLLGLTGRRHECWNGLRLHVKNVPGHSSAQRTFDCHSKVSDPWDGGVMCYHFSPVQRVIRGGPVCLDRNLTALSGALRI
jgi:hypothetical protein